MTLEEFAAGEQKTEGDPDNVVLCLLAADEDDDRDVALQIHFTLIQAFCCENDINILRVSNPGRLAELLLLGTGGSAAASGGGAEQPPDLHCVLVTNPHSSQWKDPALSQLICFCRESRYMDQWVPVINLPER
uniref:Growth arrest and DNA damage-inducible protein GADD45 alpha n=1 Tax=Vombatus ursinus TaxID=29139 RepID=A0A4X2L914_VOMUR